MPDSSRDGDEERSPPPSSGLIEMERHDFKIASRSHALADPHDDGTAHPKADAHGNYCDPVRYSTAISVSTGPLAAAGWWVATLATLVVLDDLTFGPFFWAISRLAGAGAAVAAIYIIYVPVQVYLVYRATEPEPGRFAAFFLSRLQVDRRSDAIARREQTLHNRVLGTGSAVALSLVIGGVLPLLLLWRRGYPRRFLRRLSYLTATIYATEFAVFHGLLPAMI